MTESPGAHLPGVFVTFEGADGTGKTTHVRMLAGTLEDAGRRVLCLREPGGTFAGEQLRGVVLDPENDDLSDASELLIYEAARAQLVREKIAPALRAGVVVLCDRFTDSTLAYQGYGRGLDLDFVRAANVFASDGIVPDATVLLTCSAEKGRERLGRRGRADRLEGEGDDFHARVAAGFAEIARASQGRVRTVETGAPVSRVHAAVLDALADVFPELGGTCG